MKYTGDFMVEDEEAKILKELNGSNYDRAEVLARALLKRQPQNAFGQYAIAKILWQKKCFRLAIDKVNYIFGQLGTIND